MNRRFDEAVWSGVERRLADVERYIPDAPAWRSSTDTETAPTVSFRLGSAFGRRTAPLSRRARLVRVLVVVGALLLLALAAIFAGSRPREESTPSDPFGPFGVLRGSDGNSQAVLLPDGRVLIVSGGWSGPEGTAVGRADAWTLDGGVVTVDAPRTARVNPSVTLLLDGRVLVAGGYGGPYQYASTAIRASEIWDPETATFTPTGSMSTGRVGHTATLLADGRVLVIGGSGPDGVQESAEVWDPATGQFEPAGALLNRRSDHASVLLPEGGVLLPEGGVLVAGGRDGSGDGVGGVEIWSPTTGTFSEATTFIDRPPHVSATRLLDGRVLIAGEFIAGGFSGVMVQRWPGGGEGQPTTMSRPRDGHAATLLANGSVLITGGGPTGTGEALSSAELWDPTSATFRAATPMLAPAARHAAILLPDGRVLIVLDASGPDGFVAPFVYEPGKIEAIE
ncbi:MAG: hypothetical protein L0227_00130 [Chloroflexi bacterium]|nr:hypothetical protein [Chloroflexota bacterium]